MDIPDISIEICGSWIWISGETRNRKEEIKSIRSDDFYERIFRAKKMWYFSPRGYKKRSADDFDMESIRNIYGSEAIHSQTQEKIKEGV